MKILRANLKTLYVYMIRAEYTLPRLIVSRRLWYKSPTIVLIINSWLGVTFSFARYFRGVLRLYMQLSSQGLP